MRNARWLEILLFAALCAAKSGPEAVAGGCRQWSMVAHNSYNAIQSNGGHPNFLVKQGGTSFKGSAANGLIGGSFDGSITGNAFALNAHWSGGNAEGAYTGTIAADGSVSGKTFDRNHPGSKATWTLSPGLTCVKTEASVVEKLLRKRRYENPDQTIDYGARAAPQPAPGPK